MPRRPWSWRDTLAVRWSRGDVAALALAIVVIAGFGYLSASKTSRTTDLCATRYARAHTRADTAAVDDQQVFRGRSMAESSCGTLSRLGMVPNRTPR